MRTKASKSVTHYKEIKVTPTKHTIYQNSTPNTTTKNNKKHLYPHTRVTFYILLLSLLLTTTLNFLTSCKPTKTPYQILTEYEKITATDDLIYSTNKNEGEKGYITAKMMKSLFQNGLNLEEDFDCAFIFSSRLDYIFEVGVFSSDSSSMRMKITDNIEGRVKFLDKNIPNKEIFLKRYGNITVYSFCDKKSDIEKVFDSILN